MLIQARKLFSGTAIITAAALVLTGSHVSPAAAQEVQKESTIETGIQNLGIDSASDLRIETGDLGDALRIEVSGEGVDSSIEVAYDENAPLDEIVETVTIDGSVDGEVVNAVLTVTDFVYFGEDNFAASFQDEITGEKFQVSSAEVNAQAFPVLWVLGLLARVGIKALIKNIGKAQVKKAAKSYLLNDKGVKWNKILDPKHRWNSVGAKSKEQVADLMARAMSEGNHTAQGKNAMKVTWKYKGETITVTYGKSTGKIGDGWVNKR